MFSSLQNESQSCEGIHVFPSFKLVKLNIPLPSPPTGTCSFSCCQRPARLRFCFVPGTPTQTSPGAGSGWGPFFLKKSPQSLFRALTVCLVLSTLLEPLTTGGSGWQLTSGKVPKLPQSSHFGVIVFFLFGYQHSFI